MTGECFYHNHKTALSVAGIHLFPATSSFLHSVSKAAKSVATTTPLISACAYINAIL